MRKTLIKIIEEDFVKKKAEGHMRYLYDEIKKIKKRLNALEGK